MAASMLLGGSVLAAAAAELLLPTSGFTPPRLAQLAPEDTAALALAGLLPEKSGQGAGLLPESKGVLLESGIASTYGTGDGFQGNLTACGQVFDTYIPQVAHKTLPCGTKVRVEDAETGKSVTVEVTDRGPYIAGRVVDLSWAAFQVLDSSAPGLRPVKVYVLP